MEYLVVIAVIIIVIAILAFLFRTVLIFWPVLLVLAIFAAIGQAVNKHRRVHYSDGHDDHQNDNPDVIDVDYKVIDDDSHKDEE